MITSDEMKMILGCYFRFGSKKSHCFASEVGEFNADFFAVTEAKDGNVYSLEVEIKRSKADFNADFKKRKHKLIENADSKKYSWIPNYFYFAIPFDDKSLLDYAKKALKDTKYGLLLIAEIKGNAHFGMQRNVVLAKKATKLHSRVASKNVVNTVYLRQASELLNLKIRVNIKERANEQRTKNRRD